MRSPIVAMLWENWRLTRVEAGLRLGQGIVAGLRRNALVRRRRDHCVLDHSLLERLHLVFHCEAQWRSIPGRVQARLSVLSSLLPPGPDDRFRRRHRGVRRSLWRGVVPRICGSRGICLRPAAAIVLCDPVDPGLTPCVYLRPMVDPEQDRPVGRIVSGRIRRCSFCSSIAWGRRRRSSSRSLRTQS